MAPKCFDIFCSSRRGISAFAFGIGVTGIELQRSQSVNLLSKSFGAINRAQTTSRALVRRTRVRPTVVIGTSHKPAGATQVKRRLLFFLHFPRIEGFEGILK